MKIPNWRTTRHWRSAQGAFNNTGCEFVGCTYSGESFACINCTVDVPAKAIKSYIKLVNLEVSDEDTG